VTLPPLAGEDHVCVTCGISFAGLTIEAAQEVMADQPRLYRSALEPLSEAHRRRRPDAGTWSVTEYLCHVRDVLVAHTIRLYRARTEEHPRLEPLYNDLRVVRFTYNDVEVDGALSELTAGAGGLRQEMDRMSSGDWDRTVERLPGEVRTARWLARNATHEAVHHLADIHAVAEQVADQVADQVAG
jgi:hypothetical protein